MPNIIRSLAVLIALVALSPHSYAQTTDKELEGIKSVRVIVEDPGSGAATCGVTKDSLRSAASFPVATSQLKLGEESKVYLVVSVGVLAFSNGLCAALYDVSVKTSQHVTLDATGLRKSVIVQLWEGGGLITGESGGFPGQMRGAIEDLTKEFVVDWTLDQ